MSKEYEGQVSFIEGDATFPVLSHVSRPRGDLASDLMPRTRAIYQNALDCSAPDFEAYIYSAVDKIRAGFDRAALMAIGLIEVRIAYGRRVPGMEAEIYGNPALASALLRKLLIERGVAVDALPRSLDDLADLADDATAAAGRASAAIDDVLDFFVESEARIATMENSRRERT